MTGFFGGAPALTWSKPKPGGGWEDDETLRGVPLGGRVVAIGEPQQQTKIGTGEPMWWKEPNPAQGVKGQPKMQMAVTLRCNGECSIDRIRHLVRDLRNPANPTDTGDRILYVPDFGDLNKAIKAAFVQAGDDDLRVGGELFVAWLGYRESKMKGAHPARTFAAQYVQRPSGLAEPAPGVAGQQAAPQQGPGGAMPLQQQADGRYAPVHTGGLPVQEAPAAAGPFPTQTPATGPAQPTYQGDPSASPFGGPSQHQPAPAATQPTGVAPNPFG